ncbi:MAG: 3-dehydroquinate synthase [Sedimentibacter sp.]|uniref:3-dehydroquinate synthase n=1 Tax=Sedimentibacter sp. TaxID=1960295 RepID=UPI003158B1BF
MKNLKLVLDNVTSEIEIERGIIKNSGREIRNILRGKKAAVITDENVYSLYGKTLADSLEKENIECDFIVLQPGEQSKSLETLKGVYSNLAGMGITRGDMIIALGGGVMGDLAGFAAATYLRGIDLVQVPTSLLAQIDSSIGGKVAVDLEEGKNLIGSFYHPKLVLIDPDVLVSLPERFVKDGLGEAIKYGCIRDEMLFERLLDIKTKKVLFENMEDIIHSCLTIKKETVEHDEKDNGLRMTLNFGHTIGHVIEKYFNYEKYSHGEAVSMGMHRITAKSEALGLTEKGTADRIRKILDNYEIEHRFPLMNQEDMLKTAALDKKNISGHMNLILLKNIGNCFIQRIPVQDLNKYI